MISGAAFMVLFSTPAAVKLTAPEPAASTPKADAILFQPLPEDKATLLLPQKTPGTGSVAEAEPASLPEAKATTIPAVATLPVARLESLFVTGTRVNYRAGPGINANVLGQLTRGAKVSRIAQQGGWSQIAPAGTRGKPVWMSSKYLSANAPQPAVTRARTARRKVAAPSSREVTRARQAIIAQSVRAYQGSCPCPYHRDRANRRCGKRSAWSRPGGASPICYASDVSQSRLATYFARRKGATN